MKPWPFYRKMQNFMPGTQPRGTYSFDPSISSAKSVLDKVNAEEDGAEDRDGPLLDLSHANIAGTFFSFNLDILGLGPLPSKPSLSHFSSSGGTRPPSSSSLPPTAHPGHPYSTQPCDLSMGSDLVFSHTNSNPGNTQHWKWKHDGQSVGGTCPPSTKNPLLASPQEVLNQAMKIMTSDDTLTEDQLLAASLFFTSAMESTVHTAHTFIALNNNQVVWQRFLLCKLEAAALLPGKGKGKVVEDGDNSMSY